jgi:hypothetical protein
MARVLRSFLFFSVVFAGVLTFCLSPAWAKDRQDTNYPLSGKVLTSSSKGAHSYQVATDSRIYLLLCDRVKGLHMGMPVCKIDDKPIAGGDTVQFRVDGDWAYMPAAKGEEEGLRILTTELKVIPPLPAPAAGESGKGANPAGERAMVIGAGMHIRGQKPVAWSTDPSSVKTSNFRGGYGGPAMVTGPVMASPGTPVMPIGPVMATPVTGGPPVMVMAAGPVTGGIVTGVATGGGLVTGVATGPVMGMPVGGARAGAPMGGGGPPPWVHLLRVQAGDKIYQLECSVKPCEVDKKEIELGDTLVIRAEKKWAYVSSGAESGGKEQKFRILSETEDDTASDTK